MPQFRIHDPELGESLITVASPLPCPTGIEKAARVCLVYDSHTRALAEALRDDWSLSRCLCFEIPPGEAQKSLETLGGLYQAMARDGLTRDSWIVAVGGGVVTDLAGYAAASFLRGIPWVAVPTSLLAQVDAAVGGKTGINLAEGKNLVGAFHLPREVLVDPTSLASLPLREWRSGIGEVVKSALIAKGPLWDALTGTKLPALGAERIPIWEPLIGETIRIKVDVVNRDPREAGERMILNFGHTLGHALEQMLGYGRLTHGEAVGIGSLVALALSEQVVGLDLMVRRTVRGWLDTWGMPTMVPTLDADALAAVLSRDKKARGTGLRWVLLESVGRPVVRSQIALETVYDAMHRVNSASDE